MSVCTGIRVAVFFSWLHEPEGRVLLYSFGKNKLGGSTESLKLGG